MKYKLAETDIYDFAGWLTTREGVMKVGSSSDANTMAEAVGEYIKTFSNRFSSPPQRPWVGLTDEEKNSFWKADQMTQKEWGELFADIEAKLKEKNK